MDAVEQIIITAFKQSSVSGWLLCVFVLTGLIKNWPTIQVEANKAKAALRGERRDALHDCQQRLDAFEAKLGGAYDRIHQLDLKLVGTVAAYRILHDDMTLNDAENSALVQARTVFKTAWDGALPATQQ